MFTNSAVLGVFLVYFSVAQNIYPPKCSHEKSYFHALKNCKKVSMEMKRELYLQKRSMELESSKLLQRILALEAKNSQQNQTILQNKGDQLHDPDDIVQATCAAMARDHTFVAAVPRECSNPEYTLPCNTICKTATPKIKRVNANQGRKTATCFNAIHFYKGAVPLHNTGEGYMTIIKYGGCGNTNCGPNYCCCYI